MFEIPVIHNAIILLGVAILLPLMAGIVVRFPFFGKQGLLSADDDDSGDPKHSPDGAERSKGRSDLTPAELDRLELLPWPDSPWNKT